MTASRWVNKLLAVLMVLSAGCSKEDRREASETFRAARLGQQRQRTGTPTPNNSTPGQGVGTITGKVVFNGTHAAGKVTIGKDQEVCGDSKLDPLLVVGKQGELKNAVIQIADLKQTVTGQRSGVGPNQV